jgi:carbon storage regulator
MLVITRKAGQWFEIGSDIRVHIFGVQGGQVKVGIDAPKNVGILRGELTPEAIRARGEK